MKVGKAAAATAVAGLVLLGTAGSASALTLDLSGIGGLVNETTSGVRDLLGGTPELPAGIEAPAHSADVDTDGISVQVGNLLDIRIGANAPATPDVPTPSVPTPNIPVDPAVPLPQVPPTLPETPALPELPTASIPETPDSVQALRDFALIDVDFFRSEVEGMATTMVNDGQGWVESGSSFAQRTAGMTVDLAGLASIRLMVASAYERATETAGGVAP